MRIMLVGDTHGSIADVKNKIDLAKRIGGIDRMIILGDFGLWWGYSGVEFIDEINEHARANNIFIFALPGNHENYEWWNSVLSYAPKGANGFSYLRTHVLLAPRIHRWKWSGKSFAIAGGAVSIDKAGRIEYERKKGKEHRSWSPDEQLTDEEMNGLINWSIGKKTDYFLTHDCSDATPFFARLKPDLESKAHRQKIDKILKSMQPRFHWHGHMHNKFDWMNFVGTDMDGKMVYTQTYGLECNDDFYSFGILDTATDQFVFPPRDKAIAQWKDYFDAELGKPITDWQGE